MAQLLLAEATTEYSQPLEAGQLKVAERLASVTSPRESPKLRMPLIAATAMEDDAGVAARV